MEFDENLLKLQGIFMSLKSRGLLCGPDPGKVELNDFKIIFKSVGEEKSRLKMVFFMILNSDLPILSSLNSNENLAPFICCFTPLKVQFIMGLIWKLNLGKYFNKILEQCSIALTGDFLIALIEKVPKSIDDLSNLCDLWCSVFAKSHHLFLRLQDDRDSLKLCLCFQRLFGVIKKLLGSHRKLVGNQLNKAFALHLCHFFESILFMVRLYNDKNYKFCESEIFKEVKCLPQNVDVTLPEPSKTCLNTIFQGLNEVMEILTVDLWMELSEIYLDSPSYVSAQQFMGERIYYICQETKDVLPKYLKCLECISLKPSSKVERLMTGEEKPVNWSEIMKQYFCEKKDARSIDFQKAEVNPFEKEGFVDSVIQSLEAVEEEHLTDIVEECKCLLAMNRVSQNQKLWFEKIKLLFLLCLEKAKGVDYEALLHYVFVDHPEVGKTLQLAENDFAQMENFNEALVKTFNQSCDDSLPQQSKLVYLCILSREKLLFKMFRAAISGSDKFEKFFSDFVETYKAAFGLIFDGEDSSCNKSQLDSVLLSLIANETISEKEKPRFLSILKKLLEKGLIKWSFTSSLFLLVNSCVEKDQFANADFLLQIARIFFTSGEWKKYKFVFLVYMAQIMERVIWTLENFSVERNRLLDLTIDILSITLDSIDIKKESKKGLTSAKWALDLISDHSELVQAHFCDLGRCLGRNWPTRPPSFPTLLLCLICSRGKTENDYFPLVAGMDWPEFRRSVVLSIATLVPRLTKRLCFELFTDVRFICGKFFPKECEFELNDQICEFFSSAMHLFSFMLNENPKIFPCYENCVRNMNQIIGRHAAGMRTFVNFTHFLSKIENDSQREICSLYIVSSLRKILENFLSESNGDVSAKVRNLVKRMRVQVAEDIILKGLENKSPGEVKD